MGDSFFFAVESGSLGRKGWGCDETNVCKKKNVVVEVGLLDRDAGSTVLWGRKYYHPRARVCV